MKNNIILCCLLFFLVVSCKKDNPTINENQTDSEDVENDKPNEWVNLPYKLNVVYFVPNDIEEVPGYKERISKILLDGQKYYADNMAKQGFGRKTYGLNLINNNLVKIITITGKLGEESYPANTRDELIQPEVDAYFLANPQEKTSDHFLIITPFSGEVIEDYEGLDFYALGKYAYVYDHEYLDTKNLSSKDKIGDLASNDIGGLLHELGHAMNAPHTVGTKSARSQYGDALMSGTDSIAYGKRPVFISAASAAILNNSQVFSTVKRTDWDGDFSFGASELKASVNNDRIVFSGKFGSDIEISHVAAYFDPEPYGVNLDYDAVSFMNPTINNDSLYLECPLSEFSKLDGKYQIMLRFNTVSGVVLSIKNDFYFENSIPVFPSVLNLEAEDN